MSSVPLYIETWEGKKDTIYLKPKAEDKIMNTFSKAFLMKQLLYCWSLRVSWVDVLWPNPGSCLYRDNLLGNYLPSPVPLTTWPSPVSPHLTTNLQSNYEQQKCLEYPVMMMMLSVHYITILIGPPLCLPCAGSTRSKLGWGSKIRQFKSMKIV